MNESSGNEDQRGVAENIVSSLKPLGEQVRGTSKKEKGSVLFCEVIGSKQFYYTKLVKRTGMIRKLVPRATRASTRWFSQSSRAVGRECKEVGQTRRFGIQSKDTANMILMSNFLHLQTKYIVGVTMWDRLEAPLTPSRRWTQLLPQNICLPSASAFTPTEPVTRNSAHDPTNASMKFVFNSSLSCQQQVDILRRFSEHDIDVCHNFYQPPLEVCISLDSFAKMETHLKGEGHSGWER